MRRYPARRRDIIAVSKEAREAAGLSQRALSKALAGAATYVPEIEAGQHAAPCWWSQSTRRSRTGAAPTSEVLGRKLRLTFIRPRAPAASRSSVQDSIVRTNALIPAAVSKKRGPLPVSPTLRAA